MPKSFRTGSEDEKLFWSSPKNVGIPKIQLDFQNIAWKIRNKKAPALCRLQLFF